MNNGYFSLSCKLMHCSLSWPRHPDHKQEAASCNMMMLVSLCGIWSGSSWVSALFMLNVQLPLRLWLWWGPATVPGPDICITWLVCSAGPTAAGL